MKISQCKTPFPIHLIALCRRDIRKRFRLRYLPFNLAWRIFHETF